MMINDNPLGYDPCDRYSFPYQEQDPPFDATSLVLDQSSLDRAPDLDVMEVLHTLTGYDDDGPSNYRMLDMALRLFYKLSDDATYEGISFPDLFAACCDTAMIWENG